MIVPAAANPTATAGLTKSAASAAHPTLAVAAQIAGDHSGINESWMNPPRHQPRTPPVNAAIRPTSCTPAISRKKPSAAKRARMSVDIVVTVSVNEPLPLC